MEVLRMTEEKKEKELTFSYKIYEAVFLSLFLSTFVSLLEAGSYLKLNLVSLVVGHSSLFLPLVLSVLIYYVIYSKRYDFNESLENWTYFASFALVLAVFSIFQEIIPILGSVAEKGNFLSVYTDSAFLHPISIAFLSICCLWLHYKAIDKQLPLVLILVGILAGFESLLVGSRILDIFGNYGGLISIVIVISAILIRLFWIHD